jgi:hypothetical protein
VTFNVFSEISRKHNDWFGASLAQIDDKVKLFTFSHYYQEALVIFENFLSAKLLTHIGENDGQKC